MTPYELDDEEFERLLRGPTGPDVDATEAARFVLDVRQVCVSEPSPDHQDRHLAAIRGELAGRRQPDRRPARGLHALAPLLLPRWPLKPALVPSMANMATKAALLITALMASAGGMAVAGILPQPIQAAVSDAAGSLGIELPWAPPVAPGPAPAPVPPSPAAGQAPAPAPEGGNAGQPAPPVAPTVPLPSIAPQAAAADRCLAELMPKLDALTSVPATAPSRAQAAAHIDEASRTAQECLAGAAAGSSPDVEAAIELVRELAQGARNAVLEPGAGAAIASPPAAPSTPRSPAPAAGAPGQELVGELLVVFNRPAAGP